MKQIDTPAFKRWFGDSKIVDANGKPLVVYHGTTADFTKFSDEFGPYRGGILAFFSTSPKFASNYSSFSSGDRNSNVIPVFLKIENPFDYRKDSWLAESFWDETGGITDSYNIIQMVEEGDTLTKKKFVDLVKEGSWAALEAEEFVRYLKDGGYDGIVVKEGGAINYAVFKPTQIKSAYGNRGTFDPTDPDIRNPVSDRSAYANVVSDAAYMNAVRRGDMKAAQRMVDAAAKKAGYTLGPMWHGTHSEFNRFEPGRAGAIYFTPDKKYAESYGTNLRSFYLKPGKIADLKDPKSPEYQELINNFNNAGGWSADPIRFEEQQEISPRKSPYFDPKLDLTWEIFDDPETDPGASLIKKGFITFKLQERKKIDSYAILKSENAKLADPVTFDDAGNVIPLSQRFDDQSADIRNPRSTPPQFPYAYASYLKRHFPDIWRAGGNIRGNDTFRWWTAYRQGDRSPTVMHWWNVTRPAWIARHYRDYRLPGVIAQIKWGTVGTLGVAGMKRVVEDAIRKRHA